MIVLQQFFNSEQLGNSLGSTLTQLEIETELPAFKTYEHKEHKRLEADAKFKYDLLKLSNLTKKDSVAFHSLAESIHSDLDNVQDNIILNSYGDFKTWQFWLLVGCTVVSITGFIFSISLWFRFRMLAAYAYMPKYLSYFTTTHSFTPTGSFDMSASLCHRADETKLSV